MQLASSLFTTTLLGGQTRQQSPQAMGDVYQTKIKIVAIDVMRAAMTQHRKITVGGSLYNMLYYIHVGVHINSGQSL